jgi:hypothetical protein
MLAGGDLYSCFTGHAAVKLIYKTGFYFAIFADLGYHVLRALEKDPASTFKVGYDLHYLYFSFGPTLMIKDLMFYSGLILNFLVKGTKYQGSEEISKKDSFNSFNIGFTIGGLIKYYSYKSFDLTLGIDLKFQLTNFLNSFTGDNHILSFYMTFGILFSL